MGVIATFNIAKRMPAATGAAAQWQRQRQRRGGAHICLVPIFRVAFFLQNAMGCDWSKGGGQGDLIFTLVWHLLYALK